jgi:hypothetical protein
MQTLPFSCSTMYRMHCKKRQIPALLVLLLCAVGLGMQAQPLSGVWRGKVQVPQGIILRSYQLELHWERVGDSLLGQAFYYQGKQRVTQTAVAGWVNPMDGTVTWTDTHVIEGARGLPGNGQFHFAADINCPGEGVFKLDGDVSAGKAVAGSGGGEVHLEKVDNPYFTPSVTGTPEPPVAAPAPLPNVRSIPEAQPIPGKNNVSRPPVSAPAPLTIEERFLQRKKQLVAEFPLLGDTLEIHFYDHAEIDGDSISIFLGDKLWKEHILLKATPFTMKIAIAGMGPQTELTMVAENLGSIPPNTSLMIAYINGQRHEARLESTENSSAMIRFTKPAALNRQP